MDEELIEFDEEIYETLDESEKQYYEYLRTYGSPEEIAEGNNYFGK